MRDGAEEARQAHNLEVAGSNPAPATIGVSFMRRDRGPLNRRSGVESAKQDGRAG